MKDPTQKQTELPISGKNLLRIGESVTDHRAGSGRAHKGLDLFAPTGSPVVSAVSGKVLRVVDGTTSSRSSGQRAGWFVDILGSDGLVYRYLHLADKPTVLANQPIQAGTKLGTVGTSGIHHSGPHVHFEIRKSDYSEAQRSYGEPVDPLTVLPLRNLTQGGIGMADTSSQVKETTASTIDRPAAIDLSSPDAQVALAFLVSKGWTADEVELLLNKHAEDSTTTSQVEQYLLSLGWSRSDVARLLVGPEKSHLTAETLFRQHAANSAAQQEALLKALAQAGARDIKLDPSLLAGLNPAHLRPESPADLEQLISQFAELPDVQKQRFLLLLDSQKPTKKPAAPSPVVDSAPKKAGGNPKPAEPANDVLPVVKSSLDLLSTALRGLLGTGKDASKKGANGNGNFGPGKEASPDAADDEDSPGSVDDGEADDPADTRDETLPSEADDQMSSGSESEPD